ncbi:MAG: bifunctional serine/threonine-protein kinase/formylglycine-generating enzyme family protein, partial [Myxococcota bacterium]|nr:bifunctional serine/threonine-protein kinase/formylglycine-generating enzyme family protein [Myxococcota bacterium]
MRERSAGAELPDPSQGTVADSSLDDTVADVSTSRERGTEPPMDGFPDDRYRVLREIGRGGMGRVVLVEDVRLGRAVALKTLLDDRDQARTRRRFLEEARATAQLEHPSIVPVYDLGETTGGRPYFTMRALDGRLLSDVLVALRAGDREAQRRWDQAELLLAFLKVCDAVGYAHARGVLHRDLKPDNVMLGTYGEVFVLDWGLARVATSDTPVGQTDASDGRRVRSVREDAADGDVLTMAGAIVGTPGYMAPEQVRGGAPVDVRADVFALGAILYEILTLERAIEGDSIPQRLMNTMMGRIVPPRERAPDRAISAALEAIVLRALDRDPDGRWSSVPELRAAVANELEGSREAARRRAEAERLLAVARRHLARAHELSDALRSAAGSVASALAALPPDREELEARRSLWRRQADVDALRREREAAFWDAYGALVGALSMDASSTTVRDVLRDALLDRAHELRDEGQRAAAASLEALARQHDPLGTARRLDAAATLRIHARPGLVLVRIARYVEQGPLLVESPVLGPRSSPLEVQLPPGSYLVELEADSRVPVRLPLLLKAGERREVELTLPPRHAIAPGFVYVPPGVHVVGGDMVAPGAQPRRIVQLQGFAIAVHPVTMEQYGQWLQALAEQDRRLAMARAPRVRGVPYWVPDADGRYRVPFVDADGDRIEGDFPVVMISPRDAMDF